MSQIIRRQRDGTGEIKVENKAREILMCYLASKRGDKKSLILDQNIVLLFQCKTVFVWAIVDHTGTHLIDFVEAFRNHVVLAATDLEEENQRG